jgi:predicted DNA-binding transcriptional regulator AlpA
MTNFFEKLSPDLARNRVLNTAEAAALLNFSIPHFRRLYRSGIVPSPIRLSSRKLGWRVEDLITWINSRSREVA